MRFVFFNCNLLKSLLIAILFSLSTFDVLFAQLNNTVLTDLKVNYGSLSPQFSSDITSYILTVPENIKLFEIKFTPFSDALKIRFNGQNVFSGNSWSVVGSNTANIEVVVFDSLSFIKVYYIFINRISPKLYLSDGIKLTNVILEEEGSKKPKWMDVNGNLYASLGDTIFKSADNGLNWTNVHVIPDSLRGNDYIGKSFDRSTLIVTKKNRIIYCAKGKVIVSDEDQKNFTVGYTFLNNSISRFHLGNSVFDSIVLLGTYEVYSDTIEAIISTNFGESWKRFFFKSKEHKEHVFHIHDIQYDSLSKKIFIATGDGNNCQIYYSSDFGKSWFKIFKTFRKARDYQTSQILCFPYGLVLGSDVPKDGLMFVPRNNDHDNFYDDNLSDSEDYINMDNERELKRFAVHHWNAKKIDRTYLLLPWYHCVFPNQHTNNDYSKLWLTYNGIEWYELFRWTMPESSLFGFTNIIGPYALDSTNTIFSNFHGNKFFSAQIQFPKKLQDVLLLTPEKNATYVDQGVFAWKKVNYAYDYSIQISLNSDFTKVISEVNMINGTSYYSDRLLSNTKYYWRVKAFGVDGESNWSDIFEFITGTINSLNNFIQEDSEEPILYQNLPNPFTVFTKIFYYIPHSSEVKFEIMDLYGKPIIIEDSRNVESGIFDYDCSLDSKSIFKNQIIIVKLNVKDFKTNKCYIKSIKMLVI